MSSITRSPDHHYTYRGVTYPGVTGILKVLDKSDALMAWASRMTAEAAMMLHPQFDAILAATGPDGLRKALTERSGWKRDESASLGSEVHTLADQLVRGLTLEIPERSAGHVEHYKNWWLASGWIIRLTEAALVNPEIGYGGTLDLLCYDRDGKTVLADIKTGRNVYSEAALQLTAYGMATWIEAPNAVYGMPAVDRYVIIHVTADGVKEIEVPVGDLERSAFRACVELAKWRETTKGRRL